MAEKPDIRVLVGVDGDVGIDSGSGKLISKTLKSIAKNISGRETPSITFGVDFQSTAKKVYKQLNEIAKSIKVEPIDLQIRTNQSSVGTSSNIAKPNVTVHTEEKNILSEIAAQKKKDVELTRQQKKEIQLFISEVGKLNNAEKSLNTSENFANKLGKPELSNKIVNLREQVVSLNKQAQELFYSTNNGENLGDRLNDEGFKAFSESIKKVNKEVLELQQASTKDSPLFVENERLANQARDVSEFALSLEKFEKTNDKFKGNSGAAAEFERIKAALSDLERRSKLGETVGIELKELISDTNRWKLSLESAGLTGQTALGKLRAQMEKLGVYMSASAVLMFAVRQIKQMTQNVIELDNALNSLQMVTGYSNAQMQGLLKTYQGLASELSATTSEVLAGSEVWLRQGRSIAETNELIKTSTVFSKVAMIDAATASDLLTSSINGYGVAAKDAMTIVDALAAVDMAAATSSEEMSVAMQKTAASAKLAGVPMNELIAYIATVSETSRASAEIVGTAMKSLFSRITQVKAGKLVDEDGEDISNVSKVLTQYGVAVQNTNGTLRDANVIISELANTWDKLTNAEQQEVAGAVAGLKQKEQFTILMENWERVTKLATVATDSNGYALEKFNVHQESTAAKMAEFQNQFQILSSTIWDSELIKGSIDTGTGFLGILTGIIDTLGTIPTLATVAAGSLSALSNKGWLKNLSDKRTYALLQSGGNTERADIFSKRLYGKSLKWCA